MTSKHCPEQRAPPQFFYDEQGAVKYANNSRMLKVQREMTERAIELLSLKKNQPAYILDMGCGSGISGETLTDAGYEWVGCDISPSMLAVAVAREVEGDLFESDLGNGLYFRAGTFDAAISISTFQWLTNCDENHMNPKRRLANIFNDLFKVLKRGARCVIQLYPQSQSQLELISECCMKAGFVLSIVVDYPHSSKAKKYYLILDTGSVKRYIPKALTMEEYEQKKNELPDDIDLESVKLQTQKSGSHVKTLGGKSNKSGSTAMDSIQLQAMRSHHLHAPFKKPRKVKRGPERFQDRDWILEAKERRRKKGFSVPNDSKYTGRKRKPKF